MVEAADAVLDLGQTIELKPVGSHTHLDGDLWTNQELQLVSACRAKAINDFQLGALLGGAATWIATRRQFRLLKIGLSGGAAVYFGLWNFHGSIYSSIDRILSMDGCAVQKQAASLIVNKFNGDPRLMRLVSKHFYSENVYDDSSSDQPHIRWRYRNCFHDSAVHNQQKYGNESSSNSENEKTDVRFKQLPVSPGFDLAADPFECVLGGSGIEEVIHSPDASRASPRILTRCHKRSHRKRRMCHDKVPRDSKHA